MNDKSFVLALDQGTTSSRSIVFDREGTMKGIAQMEFPQIYPQPGWVEHDPKEIWYSQFETAKQAIRNAEIDPARIAAIGITNQRETTVLWYKNTGEPVCNAIVWQCRRTADFCSELAKDPALVSMISEKTGLKPDAYFSATKIRWIFDNVPGVRERAEAGEILFGTVDCYLLWQLTGVHATDVTNASRTLLFNIHTMQWDAELLDLFGIPASVLPEVRPSIGYFGTTKVELFGCPIPVTGIAGDQHAALFGQACFAEGDAKNTYGTGCFLMMNTGSRPVPSKNGLVTTVAWSRGDQVTYALEGSVFIGGAVLQWLRDELKIITSAPEADILAAGVDNGGVYFVPAFTGLGAPYWDMYARGTITGLTRGTTRENIIRAALESIVFQTNDLLTAMREDTGVPFSSLKVDGGASRSDIILQLQADLLQAPVDRPVNTETTAQGAAFMAGLGAGLWKDEGEIAAKRRSAKTFAPAMDDASRETLLAGWKQAVGRTLYKG
ncbi:MAG: glycerol kinase GlpK [Clostridia bacterium]|nr:glycerol kinase GlpK [Clostridia bacterium]